MTSPIAARIFLTVCLALTARDALGQGNLQVQVPEERTIAAGKTDAFSVDLMKDQFLALTVVQRGIDVGIAVVDPDGVQLRLVDGADGSGGTESITVVAESTGQYHFQVLPLDPFRNPAPGRYEIKIVEIRAATDQELRDGKIRGLAKAQGLLLLDDIEQLIREVRDPQTRAQYQIRSGNLLWGADDIHAAKLMTNAMDSLNEIFAAAAGRKVTLDSEEFRAAMQLRRQLLESLVSRQPELALTFLRTTRMPSDLNNVSDNRQWDRNFELTAANEIVATNPQRAVQIAEDVLKEGTAQGLIELVRALQSKSPDLAANLARDIMTSLANQRLLADAATANLAIDVIQFALTTGRNPAAGKSGLTPLLSSAEFTNFYQKALSEVLAYSPPDSGAYTAERHAAQSLGQALAERTDALQNLSTDRSSALSRKLAQLSVTSRVQPTAPDVNSGTVDRGLSIAERAPSEMRDSLYQQLANKAAIEGDLERARQIIDDYLPPSTRQGALASARRQAIYTASSNGNFEGALRFIQTEPSADTRAAMLGQIVSQIGPSVKNSTAASLLEQIRSMLDPSTRAEGEQEMKTLLGISAVVSRFNPAAASGVIEPLVDQFNDLSLSAVVMNGFREKYYRNGDLLMDGNNLAGLAKEFAKALSNLALSDTQRAKTTADRMRPVTVRIEIYLEMAAKAIRSPSLFN
jgi:hypothetical protein